MKEYCLVKSEDDRAVVEWLLVPYKDASRLLVLIDLLMLFMIEWFIYLVN